MYMNTLFISCFVIEKQVMIFVFLFVIGVFFCTKQNDTGKKVGGCVCVFFSCTGI